MAVDKLVVRLEAEQTFPKGDALPIHDQVSVRTTQSQAQYDNIWIEPYTSTVMIRPKQFMPGFASDAGVTRYGVDDWLNAASYGWDECSHDANVWLISNGDDREIETTASFNANVGFFLEFYLFGSEHDHFEALNLTFGQWLLKIWSNGYCELFKTGSSALRAIGYLTSASRNSLCNRYTALSIMPSGDGTLFIRRSGVAGFSYKLPEDEFPSGNIIDAGSFAIKAPGSKIRFQLTKMAYPTGVTAYYLAPNRKLAKPPAAEQSVTVTTDWLNLGGGIVDGVYNPLTAGQTFDDATLFTPDGVKDTYCYGVTMTPNGAGEISPFFRGAKIEFDAAEPAAPSDPADITADVKSCEITVGDDILATEAHIVIRNPENHPIYGVCNRLCEIRIGSQVILKGVLKDPPRLLYSDRSGDYYELSVSSIAKWLDKPCLPEGIRFDKLVHTDCAAWLCRYGQIAAQDLEIQTDTEPLRDSTQGQAKEHSELETKAGDRPKLWLDKLEDETGWLFTDGPAAGGDFVLKYLDPLDLSDDPLFTYYFKMADSPSGDDTGYDLIHSAWHTWSEEPESNELWFVGTNERGERIAAVYRDTDSQNPSHPDPKPDNWMGSTESAEIPVPGTVTMGLLKAIAYRVGSEVSQRLDCFDTELDWKPGLWRGSVIRAEANGDTRIQGAGNYRITGMRIRFEDESQDYPIRRAHVTGVQSSVKRRAPGGAVGMSPVDRKLLRDIRNVFRGGAKSAAAHAGEKIPGAKDDAGIGTGTGPITTVEVVTPGSPPW
jgi:hypothetical protein